jgi:hypothetical protein
MEHSPLVRSQVSFLRPQENDTGGGLNQANTLHFVEHLSLR